MHRAPCAEMPLRAARLIRLDFSSRRSRTPSCLNTHPLPQRSVDYARTGRKNRQRGVYCRAASRDDLEEVQLEIAEQQATMALHAAKEEYAEAALLRDSLAMLQLRRRVMEMELKENAQRVHLKVGQVIRHRKYDYKGVIVGYDRRCAAPESWIRHMGVDTLPHGRHQPFYHVLCDKNDRPTGDGATTYVAQENCNPLPPGAASAVDNLLVSANFEAFINGRYVPRPHIAEQFPDLDEADGGAINRAVDTQQASPAMQESAATASAADKDSRQSGTLDDDAEGGFTGGATDAGLRGEEPTSGSPLDPGADPEPGQAN